MFGTSALKGKDARSLILPCNDSLSDAPPTNDIRSTACLGIVALSLCTNDALLRASLCSLPNTNKLWNMLMNTNMLFNTKLYIHMRTYIYIYMYIYMYIIFIIVISGVHHKKYNHSFWCAPQKS